MECKWIVGVWLDLMHTSTISWGEQLSMSIYTLMENPMLVLCVCVCVGGGGGGVVETKRAIVFDARSAHITINNLCVFFFR